MRKNPEYKRPAVIAFDPEVLKGLFEAVLRPTHDQKWADLRAADAEFARAALAKANTIEGDETISSREAYLQGVADMHAAVNRQRLIMELDDFNPDLLLRPDVA
jgi:hypothetical protein